MVRVYYNPENFEKLRRAQELGGNKGFTAIQIALAYVMHQPYPTFPIVGPCTLDELDSSLERSKLNCPTMKCVGLTLKTEILLVSGISIHMCALYSHANSCSFVRNGECRDVSTLTLSGLSHSE